MSEAAAQARSGGAHGLRVPGRIKARFEDFVVEELPAYEPSGDGEHVFVRITKTDLTTLEAVRRVARALACDAREAGFAGMKDRHGVTTQTLSMHAPRGVKPADLAARALAMEVDGVSVVSATPHGNKLKPGHLAGNRFAIAVRGVPLDRVADVGPAFERIAREGVPNAFGAQRFGRPRLAEPLAREVNGRAPGGNNAGRAMHERGDNVSQALAWLRDGGPPPRDSRLQRLLWSSVQSAVFNAVLERRMADGTWASALEGDLLKLRSSGGLFLCVDVQADHARAVTGEVSPTGPMIGEEMRWPEGAPCELERHAAHEILGENFDLARTRRLGEGTRRPLRIWVQDLRWEVENEVPHEPNGHGAACVRVYFVLPKGSYATTVLGTVFDLEEAQAEEA